MKTFILVLQVLSCIGLIATVLLQTGKSAGLGSVAGGAEELFGGSKKGMNELFSKLSTVSAVAFLVLTLVLCVI